MFAVIFDRISSLSCKRCANRQRASPRAVGKAPVLERRYRRNIRQCLQSVLAIIELNVADRISIAKTIRQNVEIWKFHGLIGRVSTSSKDVKRSRTTRGVEDCYAEFLPFVVQITVTAYEP